MSQSNRQGNIQMSLRGGRSPTKQSSVKRGDCFVAFKAPLATTYDVYVIVAEISRQGKSIS